MDNNVIEPNADSTGFDSFDNSDSGNQDANSNSSSGNSGDQNGQQPNSWEAKEKNYQQQLRALNKQLIQARRGGGQNQPQNDQVDPNDPMNQYGTALQIATGKLREGMENVFGLYPEVSQAEISRIRKNPWAFVSQETYINGDFEAAQLEIEEYLLDLAEGQNNNPTPQPSPANINPNPAPQAPQGDRSGTDEDEDPMTMPMSKLEKLVKRETGKLKSQNS